MSYEACPRCGDEWEFRGKDFGFISECGLRTMTKQNIFVVLQKSIRLLWSDKHTYVVSEYHSFSIFRVNTIDPRISNDEMFYYVQKLIMLQ
jgi:hypothetical protein